MSETAAPAKRYRVLVIDDDALSRELISLQLGSYGHSVASVASGEEALARLAGGAGDPPEVLLVDLQMPGESGRELGTHLREVAGDARVLAMSASQPNEHEIGTYDGLLLKPLSLEEFQTLAAGDTLGGNEQARPAVQQEAVQQEEALNETIFSALRGSMPESAVAEIYRACLEDTRARSVTMREQLTAGDEIGLRSIAHAIKGGAGMVGAAHIAGLARQLENAVYQREAIPAVLDQMLAASAELERILLSRIDLYGTKRP